MPLNPMSRSRSSRGFTVVEAVVVVATLVLLLALLLPAVSKAREQQRREQCQDRLRNLGLALHNYESTFGCLPPGWVTAHHESPAGSGLGWTTSILPFLDLPNLFNAIDFSVQGLRATPSPRATQHTIALQTKLPVYRCPSDVAPGVNPIRGGWPTCNYSGNSGPRAQPRWLPAAASQFWPGQVPPRFNSQPVPGPVNALGVFSVNSSIRFSAMTDGTSSTIMAGERGAASGAGIWPGVTGNAHETDLLTDGSHASRFGTNSGFSSSHGVINVLLADGGVRALSMSIESQPTSSGQVGLLQRLMGVNDNQIIGEF